MAVPRPLLLALIGVVLLVATFAATRNSSETTSSSSTPAAPVTKAQAAPKAPALKKSKPVAPAAKPAKSAAQPKTHSAAKARPQAHKAAKPHARRARAASPAAVERALAKRKIVVLAFFQPGADDRATQSAVRALQRRHVAVVFSERIGRIGSYRSVVGNLGVSQAPAVVIVNQKRQARVVEGYVDAETLAQEVVDARG